MAKKISQLTQATEVKSDDVTVIVQDGETKKLPLNMMVTKQDIENKKIAGLAKLDEIEATYENDAYTPTITVKNKSSVKTGEGDEVDYSANVMDGHAKSAILSGQTLVNLANLFSFDDDVTTSSHFIDKTVCETSKLQVNKPYLICFKPTVKENLNTGNYVQLQLGLGNSKNITLAHPTVEGNSYTYNINHNKWNFIKVTFKDFLGCQYLTVRPLRTASPSDDKPITYNVNEGFMLLEYQQDMENWDIPFFRGMQSVKMPVLTTIGKNLVDLSTCIYGEGLNSVQTGFIRIQPNKNFIASIKNQHGSTASFYTQDKQLITNMNGFRTTSPSNAYYLKWSISTKDTTADWASFQIEEGTTATTYEPYKSNILTVNEEVTLRGIGDVRDTLDLMTGEITQRIGEVVLDGSDDEIYAISTHASQTLYTLYRVGHVRVKTVHEGATDDLLCDKLPSKSHGIYNKDELGVHNKLETLYMNLPNELTGASISGLRAYLQSNPITIQYELETPIVKTVDLMPSGTHPSTTPYCWKNGLIQLSSSGLLPNLEYSVVTSRAGQINQNATMIVKNDKRIFDLEILLAGGLVNTTYQALTLQNQVETGLSKVSLNSETEPDYLLYHMIMKLIEEKAYKLDDLTEKVSVFYLYEKLSDEQFETIYSALYPFVEDEIVEEPVVEELPEVVEDEVIM